MSDDDIQRLAALVSRLEAVASRLEQQAARGRRFRGEGGGVAGMAGHWSNIPQHCITRRIPSGNLRQDCRLELQNSSYMHRGFS